jgi:hypothetical protein
MAAHTAKAVLLCHRLTAFDTKHEKSPLSYIIAQELGIVYDKKKWYDITGRDDYE